MDDGRPPAFILRGVIQRRFRGHGLGYSLVLGGRRSWDYWNDYSGVVHRFLDRRNGRPEGAIIAPAASRSGIRSGWSGRATRRFIHRKEKHGRYRELVRLDILVDGCVDTDILRSRNPAPVAGIDRIVGVPIASRENELPTRDIGGIAGDVQRDLVILRLAQAHLIGYVEG